VLNRPRVCIPGGSAPRLGRTNRRPRRLWKLEAGCWMLDVRCAVPSLLKRQFGLRTRKYAKGKDLSGSKATPLGIGHRFRSNLSAWFAYLAVPSALSRCNASPFYLLRRSSIQRTPHSQSRLLHHMRVNLRGAHVLVPEQFLNGANRPARCGARSDGIASPPAPDRITAPWDWERTGDHLLDAFVMTGLGFGSCLNRCLQKGKLNYAFTMIPNRASFLKLT